ncbi:MAG: glycosyltransferase [Prevotellaceae bacterium]|jgi:glycosyltransferase involved in cell wall biosynthesis|nr:glycosyltransferase [Prevotellaceae bacterium]
MAEIFGYYFFSFKCIVLLLVIVTFGLQIYYYIGVFGRVVFKSRKEKFPPPAPEPVSVIICARNEQEALQRHLKFILEQDYPEYEVIVVNDGSEDDSEILLASMQGQYPHLNFRTLVKDDIFTHSKKMPLGVGIKAAVYDLLLFIDVDCRPSGPQWLRSMQRHFTDKTDIVLGYTRLENNPLWLRADRFMQAFHYFGKALRHKPYMGIGSNLAYRKNLFFENKGFDGRITEKHCEDRIFINKVANRTNTKVSLRAEATTISALRISPQRWRRERLKELRSFKLCKRRHRFPELAEVLFRLVFFAVVAIAIIQFIERSGREVEYYPILFLLVGIFVLRFVLQIIVFTHAQRRLGEKRLIPMLFLWDIVFPFIYIVLVIKSLLPAKKTRNRGLWY